MLIIWFCWLSLDDRRTLIGTAAIGKLAFLIHRSPTKPSNLHGFAKVKGSLIASLLAHKLLFIYYTVFTLISIKDKLFI